MGTRSQRVWDRGMVGRHLADLARPTNVARHRAFVPGDQVRDRDGGRVHTVSKVHGDIVVTTEGCYGWSGDWELV